MNDDTKNRRVFLSTLISLFGAATLRSVPLPALEWSEQAQTWTLPRCVCGDPGAAVIKVKMGRFSQFADDGELGRGTGSLWHVVCKKHIADYPDHDGIELDT